MRSGECRIAMGGRSPNEGRPAIPHSAFRTPHWDGRGGEVKIAVVFDTLHPDWEDADYKKEVEAKVEEAEYDVGRALMAQGHDVLMVGVADQLAPVLDRLATFQPKLVFNGASRSAGTPGTSTRSPPCWRCTAIGTRDRLRRACSSPVISRSPRRSSRTTRFGCRRSPSFARARSRYGRRSCGSRSS